jgi:putative flavoprotein involved in K+ transport
VHFANDLPVRLAEADHNVRRLRDAVDAYVERFGVDAPVDDASPPAPATWAHQAPRSLDLVRAGVTTVVWATGYSRDFSWINAPVFDAEGEPVQSRGVTAAAGLYFLGLRWLYRRKSNIIGGVGDDAEYLAEVIAGGDQAMREAVA